MLSTTANPTDGRFEGYATGVAKKAFIPRSHRGENGR
jgi:hypothetical protein